MVAGFGQMGWRREAAQADSGSVQLYLCGQLIQAGEAGRQAATVEAVLLKASSQQSAILRSVKILLIKKSYKP